MGRKLLIACLVVLGWLGAYVLMNKSPVKSEDNVAQVRDVPDQGGLPIGGPFRLTDHDGNIRTDRDFRGKLMIVYFGYSYCPDVCPTGLYNLQQAMDNLGEDAKKCQVLFITIDPERDTTDALALYMENFGDRFIGLTGTPEELTPVYKSYHVYAAKAEDNRGANDYLMDHSSIIYVMDRKGKYVTSFSHQTSPSQMAAIIKPYL